MDPAALENTNQPAQVPESPMLSAQDINTPQISSKNSKKKNIIIAIIAAFFVLLGVILYVLLTHDNYKFTINGNPVSESDFRQVYAHYKSQDSQNTQKALSDTKNIFTEEYVLKYEYLKKHSQSDLDKATKNSDPSGGFDALNSEVIFLRNQVFKDIGVKMISGNALRLWTAEPLPQAQNQALTNFMTQKLTSYKKEFEAGATFSKIQKEFLTDPQVASQPIIASDTAQFVNMNPQHPDFEGKNLIQEVFSTKANSMTDVIDMSNNRFLMYGIFYISQSTGGNYDDPRQWLADQENSLKVISDFSDYK